jgi:hypothetical protein
MQIFLMMMLILVFTIPLMAASVQVDAGTYFLRRGTINRQGVTFSQQELFDSNIAVLAVGAKETYQFKYTYVPVNGTHNVDHSRRSNTNYVGGGSRIESGRH